jgi:hypothetical protein
MRLTNHRVRRPYLAECQRQFARPNRRQQTVVRGRTAVNKRQFAREKCRQQTAICGRTAVNKRRFSRENRRQQTTGAFDVKLPTWSGLGGSSHPQRSGPAFGNKRRLPVQ